MAKDTNPGLENWDLLPLNNWTRSFAQTQDYDGQDYLNLGQGSSKKAESLAEEFRPMRKIINPRRHEITMLSRRKAMLMGFSPRYAGNIYLASNQSASIPENKNCSLFILGLPPTLTTHELLSNIRDIGRVFATHINRPDPDKGHHTAAAKVIFFERAAAERFYDRFNFRGFFILEYPLHPPARVLWNRIRTAEQTGQGMQYRSRVLNISGPSKLVNEAVLSAYFNTKIIYQVDEVIVLCQENERALVEFRFGSYRCQAEAARMALCREWTDHGVRVFYGKDPCDRSDNFGRADADMYPIQASQEPLQRTYPTSTRPNVFVPNRRILRAAQDAPVAHRPSMGDGLFYLTPQERAASQALLDSMAAAREAVRNAEMDAEIEAIVQNATNIRFGIPSTPRPGLRAPPSLQPQQQQHIVPPSVLNSPLFATTRKLSSFNQQQQQMAPAFGQPSLFRFQEQRRRQSSGLGKQEQQVEEQIELE
jgi:hypothetical protein